MLGPIRFRCVRVWISPGLPCKYIHVWLYAYSITIWAVLDGTWVLLKSGKYQCLFLCSIFSAPSIVVYTVRQFALLAAKARLLLFAFFKEFCCFVFGAIAPSRPWPSHSWGFYITHNDAQQWVELLWTSDQLSAETSAWQHTTFMTNIHATGGIRTHKLSRRAAADLRLRPRGHWERFLNSISQKY